LLTADPEIFLLKPTRLTEIGFEKAGYHLVSRWTQRYGAAHSYHLRLNPNAEVELTFAALDWAATNPIDAQAMD
jgi:hypothetical protein